MKEHTASNNNTSPCVMIHLVPLIAIANICQSGFQSGSLESYAIHNSDDYGLVFSFVIAVSDVMPSAPNGTRSPMSNLLLLQMVTVVAESCSSSGQVHARHLHFYSSDLSPSPVYQPRDMAGPLARHVTTHNRRTPAATCTNAPWQGRVRIALQRARSVQFGT